MFRLYGVPTQNTLKAAYVLDAVGVDYEFKLMDMINQEHKNESFLQVNPMGKVPALKHNDFSVFESGAICRYIANNENSKLYPSDPEQRAKVDQWLDFYSCHLGRWFSSLFFQQVLKEKFGMGEPDKAACEEALNFVNQQIIPVEKHLGFNSYLAGESPTIADFAAFAYMEQAKAINYDLSPYPKISQWFEKMAQLDSIKKTRTKVSF